MLATETARNIFGLRRNVQIQDVPFKWMADLFRNVLEGDKVSSKEETTTVIQQFVNAEEHFFRPMAAPILNNQKELIGVILIFKDVTEQLEHDELKQGVISTVFSSIEDTPYFPSHGHPPPPRRESRTPYFQTGGSIDYRT